MQDAVRGEGQLVLVRARVRVRVRVRVTVTRGVWQAFPISMGGWFQSDVASEVSL